MNNSNAVDSQERNPGLIQRLREGDTAAVEVLYNIYFDRVYSMVFNQVGRNHNSAEEVVQEAWLAVIKSARTFKGQSQLNTWLYAIVWHKIRDFQRRHYREMAGLRESSTSLDIPELEVIDSEPLPQEVMEREETGDLVRKALSYLPDHYQQALMLKYLENMSAREIAQVMGKSAKSVESLLDRARPALRDKIIEMNR